MKCFKGIMGRSLSRFLIRLITIDENCCFGKKEGFNITCLGGLILLLCNHWRITKNRKIKFKAKNVLDLVYQLLTILDLKLFSSHWQQMIWYSASKFRYCIDWDYNMLTSFHLYFLEPQIILETKLWYGTLHNIQIFFLCLLYWKVYVCSIENV